MVRSLETVSVILRAARIERRYLAQSISRPYLSLVSGNADNGGRPKSRGPDRPLRVLALESSADDSCAAVVTSSLEILSNVVIKQHHLNVAYGGIHPLVAQKAHEANVPRAIQQALMEAKVTPEDLDAIAYTRGPGMHACLAVSSASAKALAAGWGKPVIGVHHMQAHALTPILTEAEPPKYPFLVLLVSGGHTQLVLASSLYEFKIVLDTLDSKIGDAFDKMARLLSLSSPTESQGALLEHKASLPPLPPYDTAPLPPMAVPIPERHRRAFSIAGILSAMERLLASSGETGEALEATQRELSRVFQDVVVRHICAKVGNVIQDMMLDQESPGAQGLGGLVVSGGVASNQYLRNELRKSLPSSLPLFFPPLALCTDNAAMIAWTAILRIQHNPNLLQGNGEGWDQPLRPKWSLEELGSGREGDSTNKSG